MIARFISWSIAILLAAPSACTNTEKLQHGQGLDGRERSVFSAFAGQICNLELFKNGKKVDLAATDCERLSRFVERGQDFCRDENLSGSASFPGQTKKFLACQELQPSFTHAKKLRFLVFGDAGAGESVSRDELQKTVANAMATVCPPRLLSPANPLGCDFAIVTGDMVYPDGVGSVFDGQLDRRFEDAYAAFGDMPFYLAVGDHDAAGSLMAMQQYSYFSRKWRMLGSYGRIKGLPAWLQLYRLNSLGLEGELASQATEAAQWEDIRATACDHKSDQPHVWKFFFGHHTVAGSGSHGSVATTARFVLKIQEECGVDAYFSGHEHHQEHLVIDTRNSEGTFQPNIDLFIQGGGGAALRDVENWTNSIRPLMMDTSVLQQKQLFAKKAHGFAVADVSESLLQMTYYEITHQAEPKVIYQCQKTPRSEVCVAKE